MVSTIELKSLTGLSFNSLEYVRSVGDQPINLSKFNVRFPKTMPYIERGDMITESEEQFDKYIFVNADECNIYTGNKVTTQNYITVPKSPNCSLSAVAVNGILPHNTLLICSCINGNPKDLLIVDCGVE